MSEKIAKRLIGWLAGKRRVHHNTDDVNGAGTEDKNIKPEAARVNLNLQCHPLSLQHLKLVLLIILQIETCVESPFHVIIIIILRLILLQTISLYAHFLVLCSKLANSSS
jgi:hypothetical protein